MRMATVILAIWGAVVSTVTFVLFVIRWMNRRRGVVRFRVFVVTRTSSADPESPPERSLMFEMANDGEKPVTFDGVECRPLVNQSKDKSVLLMEPQRTLREGEACSWERPIAHLVEHLGCIELPCEFQAFALSVVDRTYPSNRFTVPAPGECECSQGG